MTTTRLKRPTTALNTLIFDDYDDNYNADDDDDHNGNDHDHFNPLR